MSKRALVLGAAGMDGSHLCDVLLEQGWEVHAVTRRTSSTPRNLWRIDHLLDRLVLHEGDVLDTGSIARIVRDVKPALVLNEADQDEVGYSFKAPGYSMEITCAAVVRMLEAVRTIDPGVRWFQPVSATMFGDAPAPQDERTPLRPMSPYAVAKASCYHACRFYREHYGMFVSCGILFGHDGVRRGPNYLIQRVARGAVALARGESEGPILDDCSGAVDIGCACEFMEGVVRMMELPEPGDYVLGTGRGVWVHHIVQEASLAAGHRGGLELPVGETSRPRLVADCRKAEKAFGWAPRKTALDVARDVVSGLLARGEDP